MNIIMENKKCSFCGSDRNPLLQMDDNNVLICDKCVKNAYRFLLAKNLTTSIEDDDAMTVVSEEKRLTPKKIHEFLNEYVIGQEEAKKIISVAVYNHYKRIENPKANISKSNILMLGPSGTGKTEIARTIAKLLDVPFAIADATTLTEAGYVGDDVENILLKLIQNAHGDIARAEKGIIYIDEIDKISRMGENRSITRDVSGEGVQQALLKIIEGADVDVPVNGGRKTPNGERVKINTENILFICAGAFVGLDEQDKKTSIGFGKDSEVIDNEHKIHDAKDIIKYGLIAELVGRLPVIVETNALTKEDLKRILIEPKNSIISQYQTLLGLDGIRLKFDDSFYDYIINEAIENGTGARGLKTAIEKRMTDIMYTAPDMEKNITILVTKDSEVITNNDQKSA